MSDELTNREAALIVASFEEAAKQADQYSRQIKANRLPVSLTPCITLTKAGDDQAELASDIAADIRALTPAKVRLRAEIRELERVEAEAKWWADHDIEDYDTQSQWDEIAAERLAAISQELAEKRARLEREK